VEQRIVAPSELAFLGFNHGALLEHDLLVASQRDGRDNPRLAHVLHDQAFGAGVDSRLQRLGRVDGIESPPRRLGLRHLARFDFGDGPRVDLGAGHIARECCSNGE